MIGGMEKRKPLTHADLVEKVIRKVDIMTRDEFKEYWTESDEATQLDEVTDLRAALMRMPEKAFFLLYHVIMPGYSFECECGAKHEVDGHTGEMKTTALEVAQK